MQSITRDRIRNVVAALIVAALRDLAERDGAPRVGAMADLRNWWRYGQESFVALRPLAWYMPERVTVVGWLSTFAEMAAVRAAIDADPILGTRLDTMVGTEFSLNQRPLDWLLVEHLLEPMIITSRSYEFDEAAFELQFNRLDAGLRTDTIRFVEFIPLNGFTSGMADIALADGMVLRPMTDRQVSRAIQVLAVPAEFSGGPNSVQVSRFHQWAVMREQSYPVRSYKQGMSERPKAPDFPSLEEPAQRLVTALRIVCGGSVVATRPIHAQHDDDFPPTVDGGAALSAVVAADISRPTQVLSNEQVEAVCEVYEMLGMAVVRGSVVAGGVASIRVRRFQGPVRGPAHRPRHLLRGPFPQATRDRGTAERRPRGCECCTVAGRRPGAECRAQADRTVRQGCIPIAERRSSWRPPRPPIDDTPPRRKHRRPRPVR